MNTLTDKLAAALLAMEQHAASVCDGYPPDTVSNAWEPHRKAAREALAEYDAQRVKPTAPPHDATISATDLIRSLLTAVVDLHNGYPIRELHIDVDTLRQQAAALGVTLEDEDDR